MKTMEKMKKVTVILVALLLLLTIACAMSTLMGKSAVYAAEDVKTQKLFLAPLKYVYYSAISEDIPERYEVTGVDLSAMQDEKGQWTDEWTEVKRNNLKIEIPATFDDQVHGELPVMGIAANAFRKSANYNTGLDFKALNLKNTLGFRFINEYAFHQSSLAGELYLPATIKAVGMAAFNTTKITGIVFDGQIEDVTFGDVCFSYVKLDDHDIVIPEKFRSISSTGQPSYSNIFSSVQGIRSFSVNGENEMFFTSDGVLYARNATVDKTYLVCYPSAKEGETYSVSADVTDISYRAFYWFPSDNLKLLILPETVTKIDSYCFSRATINIFWNPASDLNLVKAYSFINFNGNVILPDQDVYTAVMSERGVLNSVAGLNENNVLYLSSLSATLKENAAIDTSFHADAVKELLQVTALTNGASSVTVPLSDHFDFDVTLPASGLTTGNNEIIVTFRGLSTTLTVPVSKQPTPTAPEAPALNGTPTTDSITLTAIDGAEYSKDNGATWQDSPLFNNLTPNTEYSFVARIKETDTAYASTISPVLTIRTDKPTPAAPAAPVISSTPTADSVTLTAIEGAEYSKDNGATWQDSPTFTGLTPNTEYKFLARMKETDTAHASAPSAILTIKTAVPNDVSGLSGGAIAGIVIGSLILAGIAGFAIFWFAIKKKKFADLIAVFRKK